MIDKESAERDRRHSVRIMGRNLFYYQPVSKEKFEVVLKDFQAGIPPYNQEGMADIQMFIGAQSALSRIRDKDEDLGDFLAHLDTKINLLLRQNSSNQTIFDKLNLQDLNLSGRGLAFVALDDLTVGEILEFHIALLPTYTYVYCFGEVVSCTAQPPKDGKKLFKVAAEFALIMEDDQEKLIQHNFKQQSLALRNRRLKG